MTILGVALGGAIGASLRYLTGRWATEVFGAAFPFGTVIVNVAGSFLMGCAFVLMIEQGVGGRFAPFVMTGALGGFTTFSAFSLDVVALLEREETLRAALYLGGSVILSIGALLAGLWLMRVLLRV